MDGVVSRLRLFEAGQHAFGIMREMAIILERRNHFSLSRDDLDAVRYARLGIRELL